MELTIPADWTIVTGQRSYSLGPSVPRWVPVSWDDVVSAAEAGLLDETHWVELKKAIPTSSREANLELARDLASLGSDGGVLVVGVRDDHGKAGEVVGTEDTPALRDRIDQVARSTVHPPLVVSMAELRDPSDAKTRGCLIVSVPASPDAPHMVDHNYWGRGDTGKRKLADSEVRRLLNERRLRINKAESRLHSWVNDQWLPTNSTTCGRVFAIAAPRVGRPDQASYLLYRGDGTLPGAIEAAADSVRATASPSDGFFLSAAARSRLGDRCEGYIADSWTPLDERGLVAVQVHEDGAVHTMQGNVTEDHPGVGRTMSLPVICEMAQQTLHLASSIGTRSGYYGQWDVGLHVSNTQGAVDYVRAVHGGVLDSRWSAANYEAVLTVLSDELAERQDGISYRLLVRLARVLRVESELARRLHQDT